MNPCGIVLVYQLPVGCTRCMHTASLGCKTVGPGYSQLIHLAGVA